MAYKSLDVKKVGKVEGLFFIPAYQRGYRWEEEVVTLLDDLKECEYPKNYCLQPIVVKSIGEKNGLKNYELIDGQQRFTTIFLICKYIQSKHPEFRRSIQLEYETRKDSLAFLEKLDFANLKVDYSDIDSFFISNAAIRIKDWFENNYGELGDIELKLMKTAKIIWYEVDEYENGPELFARLNIGKIPLTNAELVKALFLCRNNGLNEDMQKEIATQWDQVEQVLHDEQFWYFITNEAPEKYPTRIEIIFDFMAHKDPNDKEKFRTFYYFSNELQGKTGEEKMELWQSIIAYYQNLREWYKDFDLYHKVGFLIATGMHKMQDLLIRSEGVAKSAFKSQLNSLIAGCINCEKSYGDLNYQSDYKIIERILLLFNVESIRAKNDHSSRFPFSDHKKAIWSLEHIHAQNSQGLNRKAYQLEWLENHRKSLVAIGLNEDDDLMKRVDSLIPLLQDEKDKTPVGSIFEQLFNDVVRTLSPDNDSEMYKHSISNMALLCRDDNSTLNNSTFDVKRNKIMELDKRGDYIPICTRRVFLKYYTPSQDSQLHFWGQTDRDAYIKEMNEVLRPYLVILEKSIEL